MARHLSTLRRLAGVACATAVLAACDIGEITQVEEASWGTAAPTGWADIAAAPVPLDVTAYITGEVFTGDGVLIDESIDGVPEGAGTEQWVPSVAYLVTHPSGQRVLLDSGVRAGDCSYSILVVLNFPCRNKPGQDVVTQLARDDVDRLDYVIATHFHGDHASGLGPVLARYDPLVIAAADEIDALQSPLRETQGYRYDQFAADMRVEAADNGWLAVPHMDKAADLLGDGSIWLLPTPGHTPGHMSVLLNVPDGPPLLTFDAAHLKLTYDHTAPGGLGADLDVARDSISRLKALAADFPGMRLIYGHEPTQWPGDAIRVSLASQTPLTE